MITGSAGRTILLIPPDPPLFPQHAISDGHRQTLACDLPPALSLILLSSVATQAMALQGAP